MSEIEQPQTFSRLDIGVLIVLVAMAIAGVVGLIAVLDANSDIAAVGVGFGVAYVIFLAGGTIACALACLARRRLEALSLGALVASGLGVDLLVLAIWLDIDSEAYVKLAGIAFVATVFGLIVLGLSLACRPQDSLARTLYLGAVGSLARRIGARRTARAHDRRRGRRADRRRRPRSPRRTEICCDRWRQRSSYSRRCGSRRSRRAASSDRPTARR